MRIGSSFRASTDTDAAASPSPQTQRPSTGSPSNEGSCAYHKDSFDPTPAGRFDLLGAVHQAGDWLLHELGVNPAPTCAVGGTSGTANLATKAAVPASPPPAPTTPPTAPPAPQTYIVKPGDNLTLIAKQFGTSVSSILTANPGITNQNVIFVGQKLTIPAANAAGVAPSASPTPGNGANVTPTNAADVAKQYLGDPEATLQPSGALDMDRWVPLNEDCANFVSACLEKAGVITPAQRSDLVGQLAANLQQAGWKPVDLSQAKPGDVVCFDGPAGAYQHVEIFAGWKNGQPLFIGSNNPDGKGEQAQVISYDNGAWASAVHVLHQP